MKTKIWTLLLLLLFTKICWSQTSEHLAFKGVPIDGTLNEYVLKMKQSGFLNLTKEDGFALLKGDFAGYKNCYVGVSTLKQKDLVYKIGVAFPDAETWSVLSGNYFDLKKMLTEKYGTPTDESELFQSEFPPKDDESKMYEVKFDRCKFISSWKTSKGDIQLSIDHSAVAKCFIKLGYFDRINSTVIKNKALDDL